MHRSQRQKNRSDLHQRVNVGGNVVSLPLGRLLVGLPFLRFRLPFWNGRLALIPRQRTDRADRPLPTNLLAALALALLVVGLALALAALATLVGGLLLLLLLSLPLGPGLRFSSFPLLLGLYQLCRALC